MLKGIGYLPRPVFWPLSFEVQHGCLLLAAIHGKQRVLNVRKAVGRFDQPIATTVAWET